MVSGAMVLAGFLLMLAFWPGDPGEGYQWKLVAYYRSMISLAVAFAGSGLFIYLRAKLMLLDQIATNIRRSD